MASFAYDDDDDSSYNDGSIDIHDILDSDDDFDTSSITRRSQHASKTFAPTKTSKKASAKKKRRPKPQDHPRRPLSAYNIFFQQQRSLIIGTPLSNGRNPHGVLSFERKKRAHRRTHGKISFSDLAKRIGQMWNSLGANDRRIYEEGAAKEKCRYKEELKLYHTKKQKRCIESGGDIGDMEESSVNETPCRYSNKNDVKRSPVSTAANLSQHMPQKTSMLLNSFTHSFLEDEWSDCNQHQSHDGNLYVNQCNRRKGSDDIMSWNSNVTNYHGKIVNNRKSFVADDVANSYQILRDNFDSVPLPVNYNGAINVKEMEEYIKPLLVDPDIRSVDSVFRHVQSSRKDPCEHNKRGLYSRSHMALGSDSIEHLRSARDLPKHPHHLQRKVKTTQITDNEVVDYLSCLLSHDQEDTCLDQARSRHKSDVTIKNHGLTERGFIIKHSKHEKDYILSSTSSDMFAL